MGVPAFFKWLTLRYPKVVMDAIEDLSSENDIQNVMKNYNIETSMPENIDNLYLDMNGIIHPCFHPQDRPQPTSEEEIFDAIFDYVDKLIRIIKPQKLLYFAIDGVAPRAKMNQQRSRRFRAALEASEKKIKEKELEEEWKAKGLQIPEKTEHTSFDSNTITPGTEFMFRLSDAIKHYIHYRLEKDPSWKGRTVIFSDSSVAGEGEHKILEFIRIQRQQYNYNPNTKHCIYGADADLIMLSLITHEPHFFIIRESINENAWKKCDFCGTNGHAREECRKLNNLPKEEYDPTKHIQAIEFSLLKVSVVREYLKLEFKDLKLSFEYDFERLIDDFVFLCFFVGNDFLPHLPSLKIREGAIDALLYLYKKVIVTLDGYLTEGNEKINLKRTQVLFEKLALVEDKIFQNQLFAKERDLSRNAQNFKEGKINKDLVKDEVLRDYLALENKNKLKELELSNKEEIHLFDDVIDDIEEMINKTEKQGENEVRIQRLNQEASDNFKKILKEKLKEENTKKLEKYSDKVVLGKEGWKARYYLDKFRVHEDDKEFKILIRNSYIEGICWVFAYYYNGCASWEWYYPFHYAPFASDLCDIANFHVKFVLGEPFSPIEQLLSVLPPYSSKALPDSLAKLMADPDSEIADFFPSNIKLDVNGQAYAWMGVNLIPFVEENRIKKVVRKHYKNFTTEENIRNTPGKTLVFINSANHFITKLIGDVYRKENTTARIEDPNFTTFTGNIKHWTYTHSPGSKFISKIKGTKIPNVERCNVIGMILENELIDGHSSFLLNGVQLPKKVVMEDTLDFVNKRIFGGERAIETFRKTLGYDDETPVHVEREFRNNYFDRTYNNNRAIEYEPSQLELLRKKRYQERNEREDNEYNEFRDSRKHKQFKTNNNNYNNNYNNQGQPKHFNNNFGNYNITNMNYGMNNFPQQGNYNYNYNYNSNQNVNMNNFNNFNSNTFQNTQNTQYTQNTNNVTPQQTNNNYNEFNDPNIKAYSRLSCLVTPKPENNDPNESKDKKSDPKDINKALDNILQAYSKMQNMQKKP